MKKLIWIVVMIAAITIPTFCTQPVAKASSSLPWLITSGNKIVTSKYRNQVILQGANIMEAEYTGNMNWENQAVPFLANTWKGNVVVHGFASDPINSNDTSYLSLLDQYVSLTNANHMYLVFSWRSFAINGPQPSMPDSTATSALVKLATRYKGDSHIIYSLQCEPHDVAWSTLRPMFESMVDSIRQAAAPYVPLILIPGTNYSHDVSGAITDPVRRPDVVYDSHPYDNKANFQTLFVNTYNAGLPVFLGEYGLAYCTMDDVNALIQLAAQDHIGWAAWIFEPDGNPALITSNMTPTDPYGTAVYQAMLTTPPIPR